MPSFEVSLTEKGKALLSAWRSGTEDLSEALQVPRK